MEEFLGVDVGGTNVKFGLVSAEGKLLYKKKYKVKKLREEGDFLQAFYSTFKTELQELPHIQKIGIGVPGTVSKDRQSLLELPNIPELSGENLIQNLSELFSDKQFFLDNDANAAALGELYYGSEHLPDNFIFITLGTGVGGGAIIDRKIFKGGDGNGLEIGHIISGNGRTVEMNIGKKGILGLALTTLEGYEGNSILSSFNPADLDSKKVVKAAHKDDDLALEVFKEVGKVLGECIVSLVRVLDIKTIIIGGGVSETYDYVSPSMNKVLKKFLTPYYLEKLDIRLATLGNEAGIIGAASLCFMEE